MTVIWEQSGLISLMANSYRFKVNNEDTEGRHKTCLKSTVIATEQNNFETVTVHRIEKEAKQMKLLGGFPPPAPLLDSPSFLKKILPPLLNYFTNSISHLLKGSRTLCRCSVLQAFSFNALRVMEINKNQ